MNGSSDGAISHSDIRTRRAHPLTLGYIGGTATSASSRAWKYPIPELLDLILVCLVLALQDHSFFRRRSRRQVSLASRTCKYWTHRLRPLLFRGIHLHSVSDVKFLTSTLSSRASGWLREHITTLTFEDMGSFHFEDSTPMWKRLLRSVPSLERLSIRWGADSERLPFPWRERCSFHHLTALRHLQLTSVQFKSLSSLFRVLGEMKFLEVLQLWRVWWGEDTGVTDDANGANRAHCGKAPCLRTPLRPIKLTETFQCTNDKAFGQLYARRATEYSPRFPHGHSVRKSVLSEHCAPPAEFWIILQLIDLLAPAGDDSLMFSEIRDDEGQS